MTTETRTPPEAVTIVERVPERALILRIEGPVADMPRMMGDAFRRTAEAIEGAGARFGGPPFARYLGFGPEVIAEVGFPFAGTLVAAAPLEVIELPGGRAATTTHVGPYEAIGRAWERAQQRIAEDGLTVAGPPWECYLTGPQDPGPPVTQIVFPLG